MLKLSSNYVARRSLLLTKIFWKSTFLRFIVCIFLHLDMTRAKILFSLPSSLSFEKYYKDLSTLFQSLHKLNWSYKWRYYFIVLLHPFQTFSDTIFIISRKKNHSRRNTFPKKYLILFVTHSRSLKSQRCYSTHCWSPLW